MDLDYNLHNVWQNVLFVAVVIAVILGLWAFTMLLSVVLWIVIVVAVAIVLYFAVEWFFSRGPA